MASEVLVLLDQQREISNAESRDPASQDEDQKAKYRHRNDRGGDAVRLRARRLTCNRSRPCARLILIGLMAASCGSGSSNGRGGSKDLLPQQANSAPREPDISALDDPAAAGLPKPLVDPAEIISGGPPPDGIPALDRPRFAHARQVDWLKPKEPVIAVEIGGEARAYPVQILLWHEIVNDTVGGQPITVSFCPLCNSAVAYSRKLGKRVLDFGTSGLLYKSALVMYDRQTHSLWTHFDGKAVAGRLTGARLDLHPMFTVSWSTWKQANPDGLVLSRKTGFRRDYGRTPYTGYDRPVDERPFLFQGALDAKMPPKTRIVGIRGRQESAALVLASLLEKGVVHLALETRPLVAFARPGEASALDADEISEGNDIGETAVFDAVVDGTQLSFRRDNDLFTDGSTGTRWDILGNAVEGRLMGKRLKAVEHVDTFWFAWAAYQPETQVIS